MKKNAILNFNKSATCTLVNIKVLVHVHLKNINYLLDWCLTPTYGKQYFSYMYNVYHGMACYNWE